MELTTTVLCVISVIAGVILYLVRNGMNYWKKRGIPHDQPSLFYGNMKGVTKTRHMSEAIGDVYRKFKGTGPFCGMYFFLNPAVLVTDLELVKKILITDFNNFDDRGVFYNEKNDPLSAHLFAVDGVKWRQLRNKLSPTFSSGKMKFMFPTVIEVGHRFAKVFGELVDDGAVIEIKEINARYTTDVIGSCAFGIECNSLMDPKSEFRNYGRKIFEEQRHHPLITTLMQSCPKLARKLGMQITRSDVETFFMGVVKSTVEYREKNNIQRNDFMSILIDLKNNKPIKTDDGNYLTGLSMEELAAQAFVFYAGGFETSSATMSFALYELARNTNVQDKLRTEINVVLAKHKDEVTYESIKDMHYLDQVIDETLRMYSVAPFLQRLAKEDYSTGDPKYTIEKGSMVFIPSDAIHYDSEIYVNPKQFDPERFTPAEKSKRESVTWLPFGDGPRNCIGLRFGRMQTRIGLTLMIKNFKFSVCERTQIPLVLDNTTFILQTSGGIYLRVNRV